VLKNLRKKYNQDKGGRGISAHFHPAEGQQYQAPDLEEASDKMGYSLR
jgi:hypothetical protein